MFKNFVEYNYTASLRNTSSGEERENECGHHNRDHFVQTPTCIYRIHK